MPNMLIAHEDGENLHITGMVDVADDLKDLVGTATESREIVLEKSAGANLEQALVEGLRSAHEVLGGYVKFAKPIVLKGVVPAYVTEKLAQISTPTTTTNMTVDDLVKTPKIELDAEFMAQLKDVVTKVASNELEKAAACPFVNRLFEQLEAEKVDGNAVGISVPCKIAFESPDRRDFFLGLFKDASKKGSTFSVDDLAGRLVSDGLVKGGVVERMASVGVQKHAAEATTRRKAGSSKS